MNENYSWAAAKLPLLSSMQLWRFSQSLCFFWPELVNILIQWGSEYRPFGNLNTGTFESKKTWASRKKLIKATHTKQSNTKCKKAPGALICATWISKTRDWNSFYDLFCHPRGVCVCSGLDGVKYLLFIEILVMITTSCLFFND